MPLPFTRTQFLDIFATYNAELWPFALALWLLTVGAVVVLVRGNRGAARFFSLLLAIHWAWAALAYHAAFFSGINPAAWLFAGLFLIEAGLLAWNAVIREPGARARIDYLIPLHARARTGRIHHDAEDVARYKTAG